MMTDRAAVSEASDRTAFGTSHRGSMMAPKSAVSTSTGIVGLVGLIVGLALVSKFGIDFGLGSFFCLASAAVPMMVWAVLREKVHLSPNTGMDFSSPRKFVDTIGTTRTKLVGLWAIWSIIFLAYSVFSFYEEPRYQYYLTILPVVAPALFAISIPYVFFVDRFMTEPHDALWHTGRLIVGQWRCVDLAKVKDHARAWIIKAFFLAYVVSILPSIIGSTITADFQRVFADPIAFTGFAVGAMFMFDLCFGTLGYITTFRPLDSHIRSTNPFWSAWVVTLMCYPPFVLMGDGGPLDYRQGADGWSVWFAGNGFLLCLWGGLMIGCTAIYAWATMIFGLRFSNLTHRGIITNGPYRYFRHPAYLSKNLYWWLLYMPFLSSESGWGALRNCILLIVVNAIYYARAKTEERHLKQDPDYVAYSTWMAKHGVLARVRWWHDGQ